jgi:hypothetical protein
LLCLISIIHYELEIKEEPSNSGSNNPYEQPLDKRSNVQRTKNRCGQVVILLFPFEKKEEYLGDLDGKRHWHFGTLPADD